MLTALVNMLQTTVHRETKCKIQYCSKNSHC